VILDLLRIGWVIAKGLRRGGTLGILDWSEIRLRVWPMDLDFNLHMNNGRYLTVMDYGRADLIFRSKLGERFFKEKWRPAVGSATIRFRRALMPFSEFKLKTRLVCWDEKWLYLEQRFEQADELYAVAYVKGLFRGPNGNIPSAQLLEGTGVQDSPPMPAEIRGWSEAETSKPM
jgi:acyl-CoA thioesterase FadM